MALWIVEYGAESVWLEIEVVEILDDWVCLVCEVTRSYFKMIE